MTNENKVGAAHAAGFSPPEKIITILQVDDSEVFLEAAKEFLSSQTGFRLVGQARSGEEAIEQFAALSPDLVLLDLFMPGMNGLDTTRRLKAQPGAPKIIIVSMHNGSAYRSVALVAGADAFLSKQQFTKELPGLLKNLFSQD